MIGWRPIDTAPKDGRILALVDNVVRVVSWGKTSHVPIYGFCLADQGPEDYDLCHPAQWQPMPSVKGCEMNWQPIETAPRDCHVLLRVKTRFGKRAAFLSCSGYWSATHWVIYNSDEAIQRVEPTHWQPIPPPPTASTGRSQEEA